MVNANPNPEPGDRSGIPEDEPAKDDKPKQRWMPRISIAAMGGLIVVACVGFAWIANNRAQAKRETEIVQILLDHTDHAASFYGHELAMYPSINDQAPSQADPVWLKNLVGGSVFERHSSLIVAGYQLETLDTICELTDLKYLHLTATSSLKDIQAIENLAQLRSLSIIRATQVEDLSSIGKLTSLRILGICDFHQNVDLSWLARLRSLEHLNLNACQQLEHIHWISDLKSLTYLSLTHSDHLKDLLPMAELSLINDLRVDRCGNLESLDGIENLKELTTIDLSYSNKISDISAMFGLPKLKHINVSGCTLIPKEQLAELRAKFRGAQIIDYD